MRNELEKHLERLAEKPAMVQPDLIVGNECETQQQMQNEPNLWLNMLRMTPKNICDTPKMIDSFILKELRNCSLLSPSCQT